MISRRMGPKVSALGVIATIIVVLMITTTTSEVGSDVIEHGIDHPTVAEEDRYLREDARTANNETIGNENASFFRENDTARDEQTLPRDQSYLLLPTNHWDPNVSHANIDDMDSEIVEFQRDQSDVSAASASPNDPRDTSQSPSGSEQRIADGNSSRSMMQDTTSSVYQTSTLPSQAEITSRDHVEGQLLPSWKMRDSLDYTHVDRQEASNVADAEDTQRIDVLEVGKLNKDSWGSTITSIQETVATETRPIEQKNVEDIRAISFQVPPPMTMDAQETEGRESGAAWMEEAGRVGETRKNHSKPFNNLLLGGGKSTKAFYEIKPSIKTEMESSNDRLVPSSTQRALAVRKFVLPSVDSAFGKFGPYFEDGDQELNITARIGSTVLLDCKIGMLGDKEVTWVQHSKESFLLLTVGRGTYSVDQRISLNFRYPSNWRLQISYASPRDSGLYKCQVATHPPLVKKINVIVTAPELTITDDSGRIVPKERHLKAGSALKLRCEARDVLESLEESVVWTRGDETLTEDVSENRTLEITAGKELLVIVSTLIVERASPRHAGNYSCVVPGKAKTTIAVHVLNGELPAAVHDVNGVSRAIINLWLIYLTMSYVFSR